MSIHMTGIKLVAGAIGLLGSGGILAADVAIPGVVPDGFQAWPATAMLGFIASLSLGILVFTLRSIFKLAELQSKTAADTAASMGRLSAMDEARGKRLDDLTTEIATTNEAIRMRPCMFSEAEQAKRMQAMHDIGK